MPVLARRPLASQPPSTWSDRDLLRMVFRRSDPAWRELVRRFRPLIYRCISKVTGRYAPMTASADLDEVYAEVMMQLVRDDMRKLRVWNPARGTKLSSWIGMISVNAAHDFLRGASRRPLLDKVDGCLDAPEEADRSPLDLLIEKERWAHLNELLGDFSERDRTFVALYFGEGLEPETVAERMAISLKTVYTKKHKIRAHLQRSLHRLRGHSPIADLATAAG